MVHRAEPCATPPDVQPVFGFAQSGELSASHFSRKRPFHASLSSVTKKVKTTVSQTKQPTRFDIKPDSTDCGLGIAELIDLTIGDQSREQRGR